MRIILLTLCFLAILPMNTFADTFDFLTVTPPKGWTKQTTTDGVVYRRPSGVGLISIYTSQPASGSAEQEFMKMWAEKIEPALSIKAPQPNIESDKDYRVAVGGQAVDAQGVPTSISLMTFVRKGRVIGMSTVSGGEEVHREIGTFLLSLKLEGSIGPNNGGADAIDVDFDVPPGYSSTKDGSMIVLKPKVVDRSTPCIYGISSSRAANVNLETEARAALLEPLPGWQIKSEHHNAMRGTSGDGWKYHWIRTDVQQMSGGSMQYLTAMSMAFPTGPGRVGIMWGFGPTGVCMLDDKTFLNLFFSLRPRGVTTDGGKALAADLHGLWRDTNSRGMSQYLFAPNGSYDYGLATSTQFGNLDTRTGSVGDGKWKMNGSELTLTGKREGKYKVRVYDEFSGGVWRRKLSLMGGSLDLEYWRIDEQR